MVSALASRLCGSPDLYQSSERMPYHGINFITCHDGFTLNEANGEGNRDGADENFSFNCGVEGPTEDDVINALRARQVRNFLTLLLVSNGVPMLLAGDEFGRTQQGNNNAYCQDNEISWLNWHDAERNRGLIDFVRRLIRFRREHPVLRRQGFSGPGVEIHWHGVKLGQPDWAWHSHSLAMHLCQTSEIGETDNVYVIANAWSSALDFELPPGIGWVRAADTALPDLEGEPAGAVYRAQPRSVAVLSGHTLRSDETRSLPRHRRSGSSTKSVVSGSGHRKHRANRHRV
jgi:glycogen operon protein